MTKIWFLGVLDKILAPEHKWLGKFMEMTNNIPAPSKGYIMTRDFISSVGRSPDRAEYTALRELAAGKTVDAGSLPNEIATLPRDMLGREFLPEQESYADCVRELLAEMNVRFLELNQEAFDKGLDLLIFPQGTRSIRLSRGRARAYLR